MTYPAFQTFRSYRVTIINDNAFYNCINLTDVSLPSSLTKIGRSAFRQCHSINTISIPDTVTFIGKYAFYETSLISATIPLTKNWSINNYRVEHETSWYTVSANNNGTTDFRITSGNTVSYSDIYLSTERSVARALRLPMVRSFHGATSTTYKYDHHYFYEVDWVCN